MLKLLWYCFQLLLSLGSMAWSLMMLYWMLTHFNKLQIIWEWMWH